MLKCSTEAYTHAIEKNTEGLIGAGKEIGLEVNALKTK